jgi:hypothetical protein
MWWQRKKFAYWELSTRANHIKIIEDSTLINLKFIFNAGFVEGACRSVVG